MSATATRPQNTGGRPPTKAGTALAVEKARLTKAQADRVTLRNAILAGQYVSRAAVQEASAAALATLAGTLRTIGDRLERHGLPPDSAAQVDEIVDAALEDCSRALGSLVELFRGADGLPDDDGDEA
jgi:phage terminase Nu1 subunit (DNA packaging protein)